MNPGVNHIDMTMTRPATAQDWSSLGLMVAQDWLANDLMYPLVN